MDLLYYKRLNEINGLNALDYPEVIYDPEYTIEVLECSIRRYRPEIIKRLQFSSVNLKIEWYSHCTDRLTLETIKPYVTINDDIIKEFIISDNLIAIDVFDICLDFYMDYISLFIPTNIIRRILPNPLTFSFDDAFSQSLLNNNYEACKLIIDQIKRDKSEWWERILNCTNSDIIDLCMKHFTVPKDSNIVLLTSAIENGHLEFIKLNYDGKTKYSPELLGKLIAQERFGLALKLQSLNIFNDEVSDFLYVNNLFGYSFYRNMTGFKYETILHDIIAEQRHELIELISNDYQIEPSISYLAVALGGNCPIILLAVLNHLVTKDQIISSVSLTINEVVIINRMCFIVYLRVCSSLGILPNFHFVHQMAIKFDSPTILKFIPYDRLLTVYDSIMCGCIKLYNYCYRPNTIIPPNILYHGYMYLARNNNIDMLYLLAKEFKVPNTYVNKYGGRGTIQLIKDFNPKDK